MKKFREGIRDAYYEIQFWFSKLRHSVSNFIRYRLKKSHLAVIKAAFLGYPYDYEFLNELEYFKLKEMLEYFEKTEFMYKEDRERIVDQIKLAISLLEIIMEKKSIYHYENIDDDYLEKKDDGTYHFRSAEFANNYCCDVYVNMKNIDRFIDNDFVKRFALMHNHELYMIKARHLYYRLREQYEQNWWD